MSSQALGQKMLRNKFQFKLETLFLKQLRSGAGVCDRGHLKYKIRNNLLSSLATSPSITHCLA